ncbi:hypothetical protein Hanom_Chr03g00215031 [Helianthus anomalus]
MFVFPKGILNKNLTISRVKSYLNTPFSSFNSISSGLKWLTTKYAIFKEFQHNQSLIIVQIIYL